MCDQALASVIQCLLLYHVTVGKRQLAGVLLVLLFIWLLQAELLAEDQSTIAL
jgi:hypothetical protein